MFAYSLNNPVNRTDESGLISLWYYLVVDHDMGYIHRAVQAHIREFYDVQTEVPLSAFGRADVVRGIAVWEIKHAGTNPAVREAVARAQAEIYIAANQELRCLGEAWAFSGYFYVECSGSSYLVEYHTPSAGVILYSVTEVYNYSGAYYRVYVPNEVKQRQTLSTTPSTAVVTCGMSIGVAMSVGFSFAGGSGLNVYSLCRE